ATLSPEVAQWGLTPLHYHDLLLQCFRRARLASRHAHRHLPAPSLSPGTGRFAVERESDTPESSRCHGIVHFRVFLQHVGAVLGRDRNGLRGNPLAIAASMAVQG